MIKLLIILLFIVSICKAQTNVYVALPSTVASEIDGDNSFILGYESAGGTWMGNLKLDSFVTGAEINGYVLPYMQANNYDLMIRPTGVSGYSQESVDSFYHAGIQIITCGGSNTYHNNCNSLPLKSYIQCGGGDTANMTCYYIEFYGLDPFGFNSQSYGHAYCAGQLAYIKDQLDCTWWEARYRARMTGSKNGTFTQFDGYGKINIPAAIAYNGTIINDPYDSLGAGATISVTKNQSDFSLMIGSVLGSLRYVIYDNDDILQTVYVNGIYNFTLPREYKSDGGRHNFFYRCFRDTDSTTSNVVTKKWYKYSGIYIKNN